MVLKIDYCRLCEVCNSFARTASKCLSHMTKSNRDLKIFSAVFLVTRNQNLVMYKVTFVGV